ncbi:MAG: hypothetical protein DMD31_00300 [Gemmatimonadetes bacterium]|nr:MAG: hypothetical protein DMD31_00300 [Gemmatimonadota bacterium]
MQPYGAPATPDDAAVDWRRYWAAIVRYRWWVVLCTALGLVGGFVAASVLKPQYRAQATVWIDVAKERQDATRGPIRQGQLLEATAWVDLLQSYAVLDDVVRQRRLYLTPGARGDSLAFASFDMGERFRSGNYRLSVDASGKNFTLTAVGGVLMAVGGVVLQRGTPGEAVGDAIGFRWTPPAAALPAGASIAFSVVTPRDAAQRLSARLGVRLDENGNFMRLELDGTDPKSIAATLNAIAQRLVAVAAELKRAKLTELTRILNEQLTTAARNLRDAEGSLESFRVKTITLPSEQSTPVSPGLEATRDPVFRNFFEMRIMREQLRRDREAVLRVLAQAPESGLAVAGLEVIGTVHNSSDLVEALKELTAKQAELRALRYRYTDEHPPVKRLQASIETLERHTIPALAGALLEEVGTRERVLDSLVQSGGRELQQIPLRAVEEARLRREVTIAENLYTTLQQRYEEARLAEASTIPDVRVLDAAVVPHQPIKNTAPRLILVGLFGGLGLSLLGAVMMDRLDRHFRYPQQVTREMGLAILGAVPRIKRGGNGVDPEEARQVIEALRTVRLNLTHAYGSAGPLLVTITSPGPGDGKSFVSGNLARAFADAGQRTLLIDGDSRRGVLHRLFKGLRKPGLTDYLAGVVPLDAVVQRTDHPALWFIGSGSRTPDAPELLGAPPMARLLASVRTSYQVILIDSSPLGAGVDPFLLGTLTGSLLIVLRSGTTDRELAQANLDGLLRLPIRVLGAVLNDIEPRGAYRYYSYLSGYAAEDEPTAPPQQWAVARRLPGASSPDA